MNGVSGLQTEYCHISILPKVATTGGVENYVQVIYRITGAKLRV
jgi:hypothetical protein